MAAKRPILLACLALMGAAPSPIVPVIFSNRTALYSNTGVAPFNVQFHGLNSTDTEITGALNLFRDDGFIWNYGDTGTGTAAWGIGADATVNRNFDYGPTAGHTYETPGTYQVTMQQISATSGVIRSTQVTIVVLDPAIVYPLTQTICFSNDADFTGAPAGSRHVTTSLASDIQTWADTSTDLAPVRLMLKWDSTFAGGLSTGCLSFGSGGTIKNGILLCSFGSGTNRPLLDWTYVGNSFGSVISGGNDCRAVDVVVQANGNTITGSISTNQLTVTAVGTGSPIVIGSSLTGIGITTTPIPTITGFGTGTGGTGTYTLSASLATVGPITMTTGNTSARGIAIGLETAGVKYDAETKGYGTVLRCTGTRLASFILPGGTGCAVQDNTCSNLFGSSGNVAVYNIGNGQQFFYMVGNDLDRSNTGEHTARFQGVNFAVFANNRFRRAATSKVLLATRGFGQAGTGAGDWSQNYRVTNNYFDRVGCVGVTACLQVQAQSTSAFEPIRNVIADHNYFGPCDQAGATGDFPDILIQASNVTFRHNVSNHSSVVGTNNAHTTVSLSGPNVATPTPSPGCQDVLIKNNSKYSSTAVRCSFIQNRAGSGDVIPIVQTKNVVYAPLAPANAPGNFSAGQVVTINAGAPAVISTDSTVDTGTVGTTEVKNLDPLFTAPTTYGGFTLQAGSYGLTRHGAPWGINYTPSAI